MRPGNRASPGFGLCAGIKETGLDLNEFVSFLSPLARLLASLAAGLLLANLLEAMGWTDWLAKISRPLAKAAHLGKISSSAFALAFVSSAAANGLLAENHAQGKISAREVLLANLFNSLPAFLTHLPTVFFLTWPVLGIAAFVYTGLTFLAAIARMIFSIFLGRCLLPAGHWRQSSPRTATEKFKSRLHKGFRLAWKKFLRRLPKLVYYTIPFYVLVFLCQKWGVFNIIENWLALRLDWLPIIKPQTAGIIVLQLLAEMGATLGAVAAIIQDGSVSMRDIVLAMLAGNVLATPMRAIRHQLPAYAGFYKPALACKLVAANQALRASSMALLIAVYYFATN